MPNKYSSGIYKIEHLDSGRIYIGSSNNISGRWRKHKEALNRGTHHSKYLQRLWNKYGESSITVTPILYCEVKLLQFYEQLCIDEFQPVLNGTKSANSPVQRGQKLPEQWRVKVADSVRQRYATGFTINHPPRTQEYRNTVSIQSKQRWANEEYRSKNVQAIKAAMTEEECVKKSERTKKLWANPEYRTKAIAARKGNAYCAGYKCTPEQIENRRKAARISNMKRNYADNWKAEYARRYPEFLGDLDGY